MSRAGSTLTPLGLRLVAIAAVGLWIAGNLTIGEVTLERLFVTSGQGLARLVVLEVLIRAASGLAQRRAAAA